MQGLLFAFEVSVNEFESDGKRSGDDDTFARGRTASPVSLSTRGNDFACGCRRGSGRDRDCDCVRVAEHDRVVTLTLGPTTKLCGLACSGHTLAEGLGTDMKEACGEELATHGSAALCSNMAESWYIITVYCRAVWCGVLVGSILCE